MQLLGGRRARKEAEIALQLNPKFTIRVFRAAREQQSGLFEAARANYRRLARSRAAGRPYRKPLKAAICLEFAGRTRERSTDRYDKWTARHPLIIRVASREYAQRPTRSDRCKVCDARVVGDNIWRCVDRL